MVVNPRCDIWKYFDNIVEEGVAVCKLCKQRLKNERSFSLRKHINKLHNPNSDIWKYFDNVVEESVAVCKICKRRIRNNRHFNLINHLKQHDIIVEEKGTSAAGVADYSAKGECNRENLYIIMDEKTVVDSVMGLMIDEGVTPQLFGSKNMQALLNPICNALSNEESFKFSIDEVKTEQVVRSVAGYIRDEFTNNIRCRLLSLRIDIDVHSNVNTYCISVRYINEKLVESCTLGKINLKDGLQLCGKSVMDILYKFRIDSRQLVSACWDYSKIKINKSVSNSEYLKEIQQFEKCPSINLENVNVERYIGVIAQLCVLDVLKNTNIFRLFKLCRNITKLMNNKPNIFNEALQEKHLNIPQLDSPWKWGSTIMMMNDLKDALCVLENVNYEQPECLEDRFSLDDNLKHFINTFCKTFSHLQKAGQKFYNSEMIYGDFYAQWLKCKILTEKLYNDNEGRDTILATITGELIKSIENRSAELLNQDHFKACLYLDPRFQHTLNMPEKMFALEYLKQLWNRSKLYNSELVDPVLEVVDEKPLQPQNFADDDDAFLNEFLSQTVQETAATGIYKKLEDLRLPFQTADTNVLSYWKELKFCEPEIYTLTTICFAIPTTQNYNKINSPNNRLIHNPNIHPDLCDNLELIRLNQHFINKTIDKLELFREKLSSDHELSDNPGADSPPIQNATTSQASTSGIGSSRA